MSKHLALRALTLTFVFYVAAVWGQAHAGRIASKSDPARDSEGVNNELFSRIYGCEAAGAIANSMGDVTEGLSWRQIEQRYGLVDRLLLKSARLLRLRRLRRCDLRQR